jgi:hypothetical protein
MSNIPSPTDRFAIVPIIPHGAAPDEAIVVGPMSEVMQYLPQSTARADAEASLKQARITADQIATAQSAVRAIQVANFCDSINALTRRLDAEETKRAIHARNAAQRKRLRDEARRLDRLKAAMDALEQSSEPTGELHDLPAHDPVAKDQGDLPRELLEGVAPPPATDPVLDPSELGEPPDPPAQPVSISLNSDDPLGRTR